MRSCQLRWRPVDVIVPFRGRETQHALPVRPRRRRGDHGVRLQFFLSLLCRCTGLESRLLFLGLRLSLRRRIRLSRINHRRVAESCDIECQLRHCLWLAQG